MGYQVKRHGHFVIETATFLLVILWIYAATSKLLQFQHFKGQMHMQLLPVLIRNAAPYLLPPVEIMAAVMLVFRNTRLAGTYLSFALLFAFTAYIGLIMLKPFPFKIPCSCGGILEKIGWKAHFYFNLFFVAVSIIAIYHLKRKEIR